MVMHSRRYQAPKGYSRQAVKVDAQRILDEELRSLERDDELARARDRGFDTELHAREILGDGGRADAPRWHEQIGAEPIDVDAAERCFVPRPARAARAEGLLRRWLRALAAWFRRE